MDISNLVSGYGVGLEQKALSQFGAAVGNFSDKPGSGALANTNFNAFNTQPPGSPTTGVASTSGFQSTNRFGPTGGSGASQTWQSSKYAADLVAYAPKHRFIFKVKFIFKDPYSRINSEFMYVVKEIDKPKVTFEYEDVNMYNFKTKVLKAIRHESLNMQFHDDIQNKVLDFFNAYRLAYSPVSSLLPLQAPMMENAGMDFYAPGSGGVSSASMGILEGGKINVLSHIEIAQIYAHGTRQNIFIFTNPRIEQFDFDNLSHDATDGNALTVSFNYDALYIKDEATSGTPEYSWGATDILGNKESAPRTQFGNQLMGGDVTNRSTGGFGSTDALGRATSSFSTAFPSAGSIRGVTSSASTSFLGNNNTLKSVFPSINQATAGFVNSKLTKALGGTLASSLGGSVGSIVNKGLSVIGTSSLGNGAGNALSSIERGVANTFSGIGKSANDLIRSKPQATSTLDNSPTKQEPIIGVDVPDFSGVA